MTVIYRDRYECYDDGRIFDLKRNCWSAQTKNGNYLEVYIEGIGSVPAHRVIWQAFNGPIPYKHHIHHIISTEKTNNSLSNLECKDGSQHLHDHREGIAPVQWTPEKIAKRTEVRKQKKAENPNYGTYEHSGEKNGMYGKHHSQQIRKKISERTKGKNNPNYGKKWTKEQIEQRTAKRKENQLNDPDYERKHKEAIAKMVQTRRLRGYIK